MGSGSWSSSSFTSYSTSLCRSVDTTTGKVTGNYDNQDIFKSRKLDKALNPYKVIRECCDSEEHPNTIPIILGLDVTGSMGDAAVEVAKDLNVVMTELYKDLTDVEFMIMGIGDLYCDNSPCQASQFESDIRIAEQLDKVYFEFGGGGNEYESYSLAWYFGLNNTKLDCWNRGKKGIIITIGDETLNPYLPKNALNNVLGCTKETDVSTKELYEDANKKFDIYHIHVDHSHCSYYSFEKCGPTFAKVIGEDHIFKANLDNVTEVITSIIKNAAKDNNTFNVTSNNAQTKKDENGDIVW